MPTPTLADLVSEDETKAFFATPTPAPVEEETPWSSIKRLFTPTKDDDEPSLQRRHSMTPTSTPPAKYLTAAQREAAAHGALLSIGALLDHAGEFMTPRFREACDAALALRDHSSVRVRRAVTDLLPRLAQYQPEAFSRIYLGGATQHLLETAKKPGKSRDDDALRDAAYAAVGRLALAVQHRLRTGSPGIGGCRPRSLSRCTTHKGRATLAWRPRGLALLPEAGVVAAQETRCRAWTTPWRRSYGPSLLGCQMVILPMALWLRGRWTSAERLSWPAWQMCLKRWARTSLRPKPISY